MKFDRMDLTQLGQLGAELYPNEKHALYPLSEAIMLEAFFQRDIEQFSNELYIHARGFLQQDGHDR